MSTNQISLARMGLRISALTAVFSLAACAHQEDAGPAAAQTPGSPAALAPVIVEPPPAPATAAAPPTAPPGPRASQLDPPIVVKDVGFKSPESVLYDPEQDVYFVSNINGSPIDADGNGFISKVTPDGKNVELMWIDGSKKQTALNAPKGLAISGPNLFVSDLTFVRIFDRKTGAARGKVAIPGATFLNDLASGPDGTVYVSDSGMKPGKDGFDPTGSDSIYKIVKGNRPVKLIADKELGRPNGLAVDDSGVWVVTFGTGELYKVDLTGKKEPGQKLPAGFLDGLVKLGDGTVLATSWAASAIFRGTPGGSFETIVHDVKSPADIGFDTKRNVILIPLFQLDAVELQKLPGAQPPAVGPSATPGVSAMTGAGSATPTTTPPAGPKTSAKGPSTAPVPAAAGTPTTPLAAPPVKAPDAPMMKK